MAISGPNHWLNRSEKFQFFEFLNFLFLNFPGLYCLRKKSQKYGHFFSIEIFPKGLTHGYFWLFCHLVFQAIQSRKICFRIFQNEKAPLQAIKTRSQNVEIFPKKFIHGFCPKMAIFPTLLGNIGQENVFYDILEPKSAFLGYKNKKFKKLKN